jgi:hypothetical protein
MGAFRAGGHRPVRAVTLRARMIRVSLVSLPQCRNEIGRGTHQIDAILSPATRDRNPVGQDRRKMIFTSLD